MGAPKGKMGGSYPESGGIASSNQPNEPRLKAGGIATMGQWREVATNRTNPGSRKLLKKLAQLSPRARVYNEAWFGRLHDVAIA